MADESSKILSTVNRTSRVVVQRLQRLIDVATQLSAERDPMALLGLILREGRALTAADAGAVFVREDEVVRDPNATGKDRIERITPTLVLKVAQNDTVEIPFREMKLPFERKTIAGYVALTGEAVNLPDVYCIPPGAPYSYSKSFDEASGYRCRSMLAVPMRNREGEIIGVLELINKKPEGPFDAVDEELTLALGSQAAVSIERTKLYADLERMFEGLVDSLTLALERRNRTTYGHCMRVSRYAVAIAEAVNEAPQELFGGVRFTQPELRELRTAAMLHDIGKVAVPEAVLDKRNKLTDAELSAIEYRLHYAAAAGKPLERMKEHAALLRRLNVPRGMTEELRSGLEAIRAERFVDIDGVEKPLLTDAEYENLAVARGNLTATERRTVEQHIVDTWEILKRIPWPRGFRGVPGIAACHHERVNGSGYPWKLRGDEIPLGGQILAIVDIFEALTAKDRTYKPLVSVERALRIIEEEVNRGALNPKLWKLFLDRKIYALFMDEKGFVQGPEGRGS